MIHAIQVHQTGGPEVLRWDAVEVGEPGAGEVRIRQEAAGVNFIDVYHRTGLYPQALPFIPGVEGAGIVEEVGADVSGLQPGDRVAYGGPIGGYAEQRLIAADRLVRLPDSIASKQAASMMLKGMTAHMLLRRIRPVAMGETILVHAAAGGVGLILCQWAKALGATVIGTVGSDDKAELARAHGCDHPIVYTREDFPERVRKITDGEGVAVVYDSVGRTTFEGSMRSLRRRGVLASYGEASGDPEPVPPRKLGHLGSLFLTHPSLPDYTATRADLLNTAGDLFAMVMTGKVTIEISHTYALKDAAQAHADLEARKTTGSIVLIP